MRQLHSGTAFAGSTFPTQGAVATDTAPCPLPEKREWTISEMARDFGVTLRSLRFYESRGLLSPQRFGGARYYSGADRTRMALILNAKKMGFTLTETATMIGRSNEGEPTDLDMSPGALEQQITFLENQKASIETALTSLRARQQDMQPRVA